MTPKHLSGDYVKYGIIILIVLGRWRPIPVLIIDYSVYLAHLSLEIQTVNGKHQSEHDVYHLQRIA